MGRHWSRGSASDRQKRKLWVMLRDRWQCQMPACLCPDGRAIDPDAEPDSPWQGSIDHIRQRTDGGHSGDSNVRAAHRRCNEAAAETRQTE